MRTLGLLGITSLLSTAYILKYIPLPAPLHASSSSTSTQRPGSSSPPAAGSSSRLLAGIAALLSLPSTSSPESAAVSQGGHVAERRKLLERYLPAFNAGICGVLSLVAITSWRRSGVATGGTTDGADDNWWWNTTILTLPPTILYLMLVVAARRIMVSSAVAVRELEGLRYQYKGA